MLATIAAATAAMASLLRRAMSILPLTGGRLTSPVEDHELYDTFHQCGGLRMGTSAETSVTDANCKVWGTDNVYVGGASVFPSSGHANCTLTALALGVRLADHLDQVQVRA